MHLNELQRLAELIYDSRSPNSGNFFGGDGNNWEGALGEMSAGVLVIILMYLGAHFVKIHWDLMYMCYVSIKNIREIQ